MLRLTRNTCVALVVAAVAMLFSTSAVAAGQERLNVRGLKPNERITATYISAGPGYLLRRIYSIQGGEAPSFTAIEQESVYDGKRRELPSETELIGSVDLTPDEIHGLDVYLTFLRSEYPGRCAAYDKITFDYFRDDVLIGTESFHDKSCVATWFTRKNGKIVVSGERYLDFPPELLKAMVPLLLVEQRIWEENKSEDAAEAP